MKQIKFIIEGDPMGKQRPKATTINGFARVYTPKETITYESKVVNAFLKAAYDREQVYTNEETYFSQEDEIMATIVAYYKIPKTCYRFHKKTQTLDITEEGLKMKNNEINPMKTPDCDNIAKICLDALNSIAYPDDKQVTALLVLKRYAENPRVEVTLENRNFD